MNDWVEKNIIDAYVSSYKNSDLEDFISEVVPCAFGVNVNYENGANEVTSYKILDCDQEELEIISIIELFKISLELNQLIYNVNNSEKNILYITTRSGYLYKILKKNEIEWEKFISDEENQRKYKLKSKLHELVKIQNKNTEIFITRLEGLSRIGHPSFDVPNSSDLKSLHKLEVGIFERLIHEISGQPFHDGDIEKYEI